MEANLFAAELLIRWQFLRDDVKKIGELDIADNEKIAKLAHLYQVSTQAMAVRLSRLIFARVN